MSRERQIRLTNRTKQIICGLFLSKFDRAALDYLGFQGFSEAFNTLGFALGARPASIKNYRDELDPCFPNNRRRGWHKRPLREHCKAVRDAYQFLNISELGDIIKQFLICDRHSEQPPEVQRVLETQGDEPDTSFAKRLITGKAAERYFSVNYRRIPEFAEARVVDTTQWGCGFDFRLVFPSTDMYFVVEVKGLRERAGQIQLTNLEHLMAESLTDRYFLFLVRDFVKTPFHTVIRNPLNSGLAFSRIERAEIRVAWSASVVS